MHHTAILPLLSSALLLGGLAAAVPVAEPCQSQILCIDAVNSCGIKYGGCYDVCDASAKPVPPPCPSTTTTTTKKTPTPPSTTRKVPTRKPHPTSTKKTTTSKPAKPPVTSTKKITTSTTKRAGSSTPTSSCSATVTVCWDGINECGTWYGGCFPDCKPWPTFTPPPCPTAARPPVVTSPGTEGLSV
ncbi:hypothetical protein C8A03DRAFT_30302 [Achaetomium macrosporum]|uniref:CBM1 domain-containing protein n=1 Tax=Achaetomium macrosporum TaxID=79813 RepID=A0AAN7HI75_9PEZI|nr:hypothetical protein C8A03DRAFT_30302 [Achaetomium macrosporum]